MSSNKQQIEELKTQIIDELKSGRTFMRRSLEEACQIYYVKLRGIYAEQIIDCYSNTVSHYQDIPSDEEVLEHLHSKFQWEPEKLADEQIYETILTYLSWQFHIAD